MHQSTDVAIIGAGIAGIAAASYLSARQPKLSIALIDHRSPMSVTSSRSGDNYRNWWPHSVMTAFTDLSIDLLDEVARRTHNAISMTRRGYLLATRRHDVDAIVAELRNGYPDAARHPIRVHEQQGSYFRQTDDGWTHAPSGVDAVFGADLIKTLWPTLAGGINAIVHIRRAGDIDGHTLGRCLLEEFRDSGGRRIRARLAGVDRTSVFELALTDGEGDSTLRAERVVIAAGPFLHDVAALFELDLNVENFFQQKLSFQDVHSAVPREQPFMIDLDEQNLCWSASERLLLEDDPALAWLAGPLPGGVHCRPDGGPGSNRVKLGWALNTAPGTPAADPDADPAGHSYFPEIVLRAATNLQPALSAYIDRPPHDMTLYGGYYTMTPENWPLIGPTAVEGLFVVGALSGFGTMAACAAGSIVADWLTGRDVPTWAKSLSVARHDDEALMLDLRSRSNRGIV